MLKTLACVLYAALMFTAGLAFADGEDARRLLPGSTSEPELAPAGRVDAPGAFLPMAPGNVLEEGPRDVGTKPLPEMCEGRPTDEDVARCRRWAEIAFEHARSSLARVAIAAVPPQPTLARLS